MVGEALCAPEHDMTPHDLRHPSRYCCEACAYCRIPLNESLLKGPEEVNERKVGSAGKSSTIIGEVLEGWSVQYDSYWLLVRLFRLSFCVVSARSLPQTHIHHFLG